MNKQDKKNSAESGTKRDLGAAAHARKAHHPEKTKHKLGNRLRRIEGQVRGIARLIDEDVYCDDVLNQITSVEAALNGVRKILLEAHIRTCVVEQIERGEYEVIDELMATINRAKR